MLELSAIFVHEYFICALIYGKQKKKEGSLDLFLFSNAKQPKLQLYKEPDKVKETGTPVEAEKLTQRRFQQSSKTKDVWLKYDEAKDAMYCTLCQDNGKTNSCTAEIQISERVCLKGMFFIFGAWTLPQQNLTA